MSHELFEIKVEPDLTPKETSQYDKLIEKTTVAQGLQLLAQVALIERQTRNFRRNCMLTIAPLTKEEVTIWQAWLPTHFSTDKNSALKHVGMYAYQIIPSPVLVKWKELTEQQLFESFEIWSCHKDNLLVGVNQDQYYLLARWTDAIIDAFSFEKIKRELVSQWQRNLTFSGNTKYGWIDPRRYNHPDIIIGSIVFAFVLPLLFAYETFLPPYTLDTALSLLSSLGLGVFSFVYSRRRIIKRMRQESPLMQAIIAEDMLLERLDPFKPSLLSVLAAFFRQKEGMKKIRRHVPFESSFGGKYPDLANGS